MRAVLGTVSSARTTWTRLRAEVSRGTIDQGPASLWRYQPMLPAARDEAVDLGDGWTPLRRASTLGAELGCRGCS